ncbi:threonine ammonia-lyase, biosynthetic [bacterium]|nr:threonine ammonia-lyase, biosynthetic [bacterium]
MPNSMIRKILQSKVYDVAVETPISKARHMSSRLKHSVYLKREDLQPIYSFKIRGAYNKMSRLTAAQLAAGVIAASAGNHAQGVAYSAQKLGANAIIVMPKTTPSIKVKSVQSFGAKTVLHGGNYNEACDYAMQLASDKGYTFVHPYDDLEVIAGQGTVGMEILRQLQHIDAIFIPVGGGGLIAGVAAYVKYVRPEIKIIGVEPHDAACLKAALDANERVILDEVGIFVDGVAVKQAGVEPFRIAQTTVDDVITVSTDEVCAAIQDVFEDTRALAEPAGALALAGLKRWCTSHPGEGLHLVAIVSGSNINFNRLQHISERAELGEGKEALLAVTIPEIPGSFKTFCKTLGTRGITEFNYRFSGPENAVVFVGIETPETERADLLATLRDHQFTVDDLSNNEVAKVHIRHMVGGRKQVENEKLFHFEFPERPGALMNFLTKVGTRWNISLFHYRNHGADYGRVLTGIQVPDTEYEDLIARLHSIGYPFRDETANPVVSLFLK